MTARLLRLPLFGAALFVTLSATAADPPAADPLPKAATARLGTPRMRDTASWSGGGLTADGKFLSGSGSGGAILYDVTTGAAVRETGPSGDRFAGRIEFTADGKRAVSIAYNGATVWEADGGKVLVKVERPLPYGEFGVSASADGTLVAFGGGKSNDAKDKDKAVAAVVWDVAKNAKAVEVAVVQNQSANVALSPDGKTLATWGSHFEQNAPKPKDDAEPPPDPNSLVQFWDVAAGKELAKFWTGGFGVAGVVFSPDGATAAVGTGGAVRLIDPKTGAEKRRLFGRSDQGYRFAFSPDGKTVATGGSDGTVQLWGADGGRPVTVECPVGAITTGIRGIRFTTPDRAVVWTAIGPTAVVWEVPSGKLLSPFAGHVGGVASLAFAAEGKELLSGGSDGLLLRWDAATGKELGDVRLRQAGYGSGSRFGFSPVQLTADGKTAFASGSGAGLFDTATGQQISAPLAGFGYTLRTFLCADARTVLAVPNIPYPPKPRPKSLKVPVWDTQTGTRLADLDVPPSELAAAAVTPDRTKLLTAFHTRPADMNAKSEFVVTAWELPSGKKLGEEVYPGGFGTSYLVAAPDSKTVLVATPDGKLLSVDAATGKKAGEIDLNGERLTAVPVFGPGGKQIAAPVSLGFNKGGAKVFDAATGKPVATVQGHAGAVTAVAFSPDGKTLATGATDTTIFLWNLATAGKGDE